MFLNSLAALPSSKCAPFCSGLMSQCCHVCTSRRMSTCSVLQGIIDDSSYPAYSNTVPGWTTYTVTWIVPTAAIAVLRACRQVSSAEAHQLVRSSLAALVATGLCNQLIKLQVRAGVRVQQGGQHAELAAKATQKAQQVRPVQKSSG